MSTNERLMHVTTLPAARRPHRLLKLREVENRTGVSRTRIYFLEAQGKFPKRVKVTSRAVAWVEQEVDDFIESRIAARDRGE